MNKLLEIFDDVKKHQGIDYLSKVIKATDDDIKANRIAFNKRTNSKEYIDIFNITNKVFQKS